MSTTWKTVRVFISSTFRDMQAERDWLVRFVFPKLREELLKYRIHLVDVDLRWGVTSDQDALGVCREVIDECRPRFMCMLGGRYGSVPPGRSESITAAEVHYGVLRREAAERGHSFFYFRDERATARMAEERPGDFREPDRSDNARKLATLKQAIIDAGLNPRVYGEDAQWDATQKRLTGLETFSGKVRTDLFESLKNDPDLAARFTADSTAPLDEFVEEAEQMEAFIEERVERYVVGSRQQLLDALAAFATADGTPNIFVLTGDPGSGKSALLAKFARDLTGEPFATRHPSFVIPHFIGASTGSTDLRRTLRRLCHELTLAVGNTEPLPLDIKGLITHFQKLLAEAAGRRRVILVFDALNQFDATDGAHWLNWLPRELPPGVRTVASVITPADGQPEHQTLAILRTRPGTRLEKLEPLTEADTLAIIECSLRRYAKRLSPEQLAALLAKPARRLPLYALTALEELRTLGTYEEITERIRTLPGDARALFGWILTERLARDPGFRDREGRPCGAALVERFAACLGVSRHGLSPAELTVLLDPGDPLGNVAALLRLLRPYLMRRGELIDFYHGQFRAAASCEYLQTEGQRLAAQRALVAHFHDAADPDRTGKWRGDSPHALSELPHHQAHAQAWPDLIATLENISFLEAKVAHGMAFDLVGDFHEATVHLPGDHPHHRILHLLAAALRRDLDFIHRHRDDYPQALFQCLWNSAWWFDCPDAKKHYVSYSETSVSEIGRDAEVKLYFLLENWRKTKETSGTSCSWLRSLRPPPVPIDGSEQIVIRAHQGSVDSLMWIAARNQLQSFGDDGILRTWDIGTGHEVRHVNFTEEKLRIVTGDQNSLFVSGAAANQTVAVFEADTGRHRFRLDGFLSGCLRPILSHDVKRLAVWSEREGIVIWDIASNSACCRIPCSSESTRNSPCGSANEATSVDSLCTKCQRERFVGVLMATPSIHSGLGLQSIVGKFLQAEDPKG